MFQQGLYQLIWGSAQVDFMLGSEFCSIKEHTHRMIEVPSVSHAAWTYCRTGKSFKMLKRRGGGGVGMSVSHIFKQCTMNENEMMTTFEFLQACR